MKTNKLVILFLVLATALSACSKKDDSFSAKYANANGASSGNNTNAAAADAAITDSGVVLDIASIATSSTNQASLDNGPLSFTANLLVGTQYKVITIKVVTAATPVTGTTVVGAYNVNLYAYCTNQVCDHLFLQADVSTNSQQKIQMGYLFKRFGQSGDDRYARFSTPFKSFTDMITYLSTL